MSDFNVLIVNGKTGLHSLNGGSSLPFLPLWQTRHHCLIPWVSDPLPVVVSGSQQIRGVSEMAAGLCQPTLCVNCLSHPGSPSAPHHRLWQGSPFVCHSVCSKPGILWLIIEGKPGGIRVTWGYVLSS